MAVIHERRRHWGARRGCGGFDASLASMMGVALAAIGVATLAVMYAVGPSRIEHRTALASPWLEPSQNWIMKLHEGGRGRIPAGRLVGADVSVEFFPSVVQHRRYPYIVDLVSGSWCSATQQSLTPSSLVGIVTNDKVKLVLPPNTNLGRMDVCLLIGNKIPKYASPTKANVVVKYDVEQDTGRVKMLLGAISAVIVLAAGAVIFSVQKAGRRPENVPSTASHGGAWRRLPPRNRSLRRRRSRVERDDKSPPAIATIKTATAEIAMTKPAAKVESPAAEAITRPGVERAPSQPIDDVEPVKSATEPDLIRVAAASAPVEATQEPDEADGQGAGDVQAPVGAVTEPCPVVDEPGMAPDPVLGEGDDDDDELALGAPSDVEFMFL